MIISIDTAGPVVVIHARTRSETPVWCNGCGEASDWVHSRYTRHLADTAIGDRPVRIELNVRRLYCENRSCPKATFAEQVDGLSVRYQRRTPLLQRLVQIAGVLLAGRGGARLLRLLHARLSRTSVLLHLMRTPMPPLVTPQVLGVDDFSLYGRVYGTLLVDADTRLPIAPANRSTRSPANWDCNGAPYASTRPPRPGKNAYADPGPAPRPPSTPTATTCNNAGTKANTTPNSYTTN